jgi:hypothetical protein
MLKLAKNAMIWSKNTDSESIEVRKRVNYLCLRIPWVYIGWFQSSSRYSHLMVFMPGFVTV